MADAQSAEQAVQAAWNVTQWLNCIGLGALMGAVGQGVRTVVGMKKLNDTASDLGVAANELIAVSRIFISIFIGAIAGTLAAITTVKSLDHISIELIFGIAAAGYTGADFIEGFISRMTPNPDTQAAATAASNAAATDDAVG
jgi:hypothetical protein